MRAASVMAIGGLAAVALAVSAAVLLVTSYVVDGLAADLIAAFVATKFGLLWFAFPLARRHLPRRTVREATRLRGRVPAGQQTGGERLLADGRQGTVRVHARRPPGRQCPGPAGQEPPPTEPVRVHLDLYTRQQARHIGRLAELGATRVEEWPYPPGADFVVMRDPDGNEFCVIDHPEL